MLKQAFSYLFTIPLQIIAFGTLFTLPLVFMGGIPQATGRELLAALVPFGIIVILSSPVLGYWVRVLQQIGADNPDQPVFGNSYSIAVVGVKVGIIWVGVNLFAADIVFATFGHLITLSETLFEIDLEDARFTLLVLIIAIYLVYPAAILNYSKQERLRDAFAYSDLQSILLTREYAKGILRYHLIFIIQLINLNVIYLIDRGILPVRAVLAAITGFLTTTVTFHILGQIARDLSLYDEKEVSPTAGESSD